MHVNWRLIWEVLQRKWLLCVLAYCNMPSNRLILKWCSLPLLFVFSHSMHVNSRLIWEVLQLKWLRCILTYCNMPSNRLILKWCSLPFLSPFFFLNKWMTYSIHLCTQTKNAHQKKKKRHALKLHTCLEKNWKRKNMQEKQYFWDANSVQHATTIQLVPYLVRFMNLSLRRCNMKYSIVKVISTVTQWKDHTA